MEITPGAVIPWLAMDGGGLAQQRNLRPQICLNPALTVTLLSWASIWEKVGKEVL